MTREGIVRGKNDKISPNDNLTRTEAAIVIYRLLDKSLDK